MTLRPAKLLLLNDFVAVYLGRLILLKRTCSQFLAGATSKTIGLSVTTIEDSILGEDLACSQRYYGSLIKKPLVFVRALSMDPNILELYDPGFVFNRAPHYELYPQYY